MKLIINYKIPIYKDNKLEKFEIKNKYIIDYKLTKKGGDIFDTLSINDLIIEKKTDKIETKIIDKELSKKENKINNIKLNENLTILNLKELIYYLTNISIENQHIELNNKINKQYELIDYSYENISLSLQVNTILNNININSLEYIENIFIDFNLVNNRNLYSIKAHDEIKRLKNVLNIYTENEIDVYNLDDFLQNKELILQQINQDNEINNIIFYGFIEKYFPMYNIELFLLYLNDESKSDIYPILNIKKNNILNKINNLNDLVQDHKLKYNINQNIKGLLYKISSYINNKTYNLQELFNNIELIKISNLEKLEIQLYLSDKYIYYEKINILNQNTNKNLYLLSNNYDKNVLVFLIYISSNKHNLENIPLYIILDEYGNYDIHLIINELLDLKIKDFTNIIQSEVNKFIIELNKKYNIELYQITEYNLSLDKININILYNQIFSNEDFSKLIEQINLYSSTNLYNVVNVDYNLNIIELSTLIIDYESLYNIDFDKYTNNYYQYYLDTELKEKYNKLLNLPKIIIYHRIKDIKIEINNINKNEIDYIKNIILYIISLSDNKSNKLEKNLKKEDNKLKKLKELDPILYVINKKNTQNLYSRKCQSSQQPEIITKSEIKNKNIKNYIKYWNFTNSKEEFYHCPNKKFPYVKFLTNLHPQNYCIPCCKKKSMDNIKIKSKYESIHNQCLENYIYDKKNLEIETDGKSRYIINYSNKILIENNRLMEIPTLLKNIIKKSYKNESKTDNGIVYNYYIYGINQNLPNINNIGILFIISTILNKNINDTIELIKDFLIKNPNIFPLLLDGKLIKYYQNLTSFLIVYNNIFQSKIILKNINYEFTKWNELFIDIAKYLGIISIIFEEDENDNLNLILPKRIYNINEYIINNENYNYNIIIKRIYKNNTIYYPLFKLNYKEYYNNNIIKYRLFNYNDNIIQIIKQIISTKLDNNLNNLNINIIFKFIFDNKNYNIEKYYINRKNEVYALLIKNKHNKYIYCNVMSQILSNITYSELLHNNQYSYKIFNNDYKLEFISLYNFIVDLNTFIYNQNKDKYSDIYYKYLSNEILINNVKNDNVFILNELQLLENSIIKFKELNLIPYIYINKFIIYNDKIIGFSSNNLNLYINENITLSNSKQYLEKEINNLKKVIKKQTINKTDLIKILTRCFKLEDNNSKMYNKIIHHSNYKNIKEYYNYYQIYYYNPLKINDILLHDTEHNDTRLKELNKAIYETNIYNLLLINIIQEIYKLKNKKLRTELIYIISNLDNLDINKIIVYHKNDKINNLINKINLKILNNTLYEEFQYKLKIYNQIIFFLKNISIKNKDKGIKELKKIIIEKFNNITFNFDNLSLYELLNKNKNDFIKEIKDILQKTISHKNINNNEQILDLASCNNINKSYYCDNKKLIISKEIYNKLLDIFYYDITNKYKQKILLNLVNYNINNIYKFKYYINEKIYIYL
jgi:hypothetical protein